MIAARSLVYERGTNTTIKGVSLALNTGETVAIIGPNGAGKSTLLKLLAGSLPRSRGKITFAGEDISLWPATGLAKRRAVLSQSVSISFPFTVTEIVEMPIQHLAAGPRRDLSRQVLREMKLESFASRPIQQLSGGEQQRVHLARVLCQLRAQAHHGPQYLFLDEPTSSLDIRHQVEVLQAVKQMVCANLGVLVVLHDLNLAAAAVDRLIVMKDGNIVADGPPAEIMTTTLLTSVYGITMQRGEAASRPFFFPDPADATPA